MGTVIDKVRYLLETKRQIKQAIIDMGVQNVSDVLRSYPDKIREIEQMRTELMQMTLVEAPISLSVDISLVNDIINVSQELVIITSVNEEDIYVVAGDDPNASGDDGEYG